MLVVPPPPPLPPPPARMLVHQSATILAAAEQSHPAAHETFEAPVRVYQHEQAPPPEQLVQALTDLPVPQLIVWEQVWAAATGLASTPHATAAARSESLGQEEGFKPRMVPKPNSAGGATWLQLGLSNWRNIWQPDGSKLKDACCLGRSAASSNSSRSVRW